MQDLQTILPTGSVIRDRYVVEDLLGKGGFGAVYLVRDKRVRGNVFALKEVINPDKEERQRFAFECEVLKRLDHPALPRVYRVFEDDKNIRVYMLMDYVEGPNLETLRQHQPDKQFSVSQTMEIMAPIVDAVSYLHKLNPPVIHRDVKPANIIVPNEGDDAVLVDFGIAKEYDQESTTTAIRRCSPGYGAPEQYARGTNPRTDIYGLAATFYALLTGTVPADALYRMTQMSSRKFDALEPVQTLAPAVPTHMANAIERAMSINSSDRFETVDQFWQAMNSQPLAAPVVTVVPVPRSLAKETPLPTTPITPLPPVGQEAPVSPARQRQETRRKRRGLLPLLLIFLSMVALLTGIIFGSGLFSLTGKSDHGSAHVTPVSTHAITRPHATATPTTKPTATPTTKPTATPSPAPQPTQVPTQQPTQSPPTNVQLNNSYSGTIVDDIGPISATMSLTNVAQNGTNISGYFTVSSELQGSNSFTGTVSQNTVKFMVASYANHLPLFFSGTVQSDGSIQGTYCAVTANGSCDYSEGHGSWHVYRLVASSSTGSSQGRASILSFPGSTYTKEYGEEQDKKRQQEA